MFYLMVAYVMIAYVFQLLVNSFKCECGSIGHPVADD